MTEPKRSRTEKFLGIAPGDVVTFVGGGGKSMLIGALAGRLAKEHRTVVTTATRHFRLAPGDSPYLFLTDERPFGELLPNLTEHGTATVAPERLEDGTLRGFRRDEVDTFADVGDYLFVEAEDSRGESLPDAANERAVPPLTSVLVFVAGLDALGPELDCAAFGERLAGPEGLLRIHEPGDRRILLLNKADRHSVRQDGARITKEVRARLGEEARELKIILTSVRNFRRRLPSG